MDQTVKPLVLLVDIPVLLVTVVFYVMMSVKLALDLMPTTVLPVKMEDTYSKLLVCV